MLIVLDVLISTDFDGNDVAAATWTEVTDQFADFDKLTSLPVVMVMLLLM